MHACVYLMHRLRALASSNVLPADVSSSFNIGKTQEAHGSISAHQWMILFSILLPILHLEAVRGAAGTPTVFAYWLQGTNRLFDVILRSYGVDITLRSIRCRRQNLENDLRKFGARNIFAQTEGDAQQASGRDTHAPDDIC